jgi:tetratricopeptide (TPR) repeat protein
MKTLRPFFALCFLALNLVSFAQDAAVLTAWEHLNTFKREREPNEQVAIDALLEAKKEMDAAAKHESTIAKSKTWKRRGDVYWLLGTDPSPRLVLARKGALDTAMFSYGKALVVELKSNGKPKVEEPDEILNRMLSIGARFAETAQKNLKAKKFQESIQELGLAKVAMQILATQDPENNSLRRQMAYYSYYQSVAATEGQKLEDALVFAQSAVDLSPEDTAFAIAFVKLNIFAQKMPQAQAAIDAAKTRFGSLADLALIEVKLAMESGNMEKAGALIEKGKVDFPKLKTEFILEEVNFYLNSGNDEKALDAIEQAIAAFTSDPAILLVLNFNKGVINDQIAENLEKKDAKALATQIAERRAAAKIGYEKTIELDPNYTAAYLQLANAEIIKANALIKKANELDLNKVKEYEALKNEAKVFFANSAGILETGYANEKAKPDADPNRIDTFQKTLFQVYSKLEDAAKRNAIKAEMEGAK